MAESKAQIREIEPHVYQYGGFEVMGDCGYCGHVQDDPIHIRKDSMNSECAFIKRGDFNDCAHAGGGRGAKDEWCASCKAKKDGQIRLTGETTGRPQGERVQISIDADVRERLSNLLYQPYMRGVGWSEFIDRAIAAAYAEADDGQ